MYCNIHAYDNKEWDHSFDKGDLHLQSTLTLQAILCASRFTFDLRSLSCKPPCIFDNGPQCSVRARTPHIMHGSEK